MAIKKQVQRRFIFQIAKRTDGRRFKSKNKTISYLKKYYLKYYTEMTVSKC